MGVAEGGADTLSPPVVFDEDRAPPFTKVTCRPELSDYVLSFFLNRSRYRPHARRSRRVTSIDEFQACARPSLASGTDRSYGAGGEEVATSSLHVTDGVPRCPSRMT